ncbi:MAG TPA: SURF1 family protein [Propionibacteriaceae bacterium]|nr:SURF1 family protein [Propionibacteriaceae bacterium]
MTVLKQVLVVVVGLGVAAVMVLLGNWQLEAYRASGNQSAEARAAAPPLELREVAPAGSAVRQGFGRSVRAQGRYDPDLQLLVPVGSPVSHYRVLSGLRQPDGSIVAVVRGIVTQPSAPTPPAGVFTQVGVLLPSEDNAPPVATPAGQIDAVRLPVLAQRWPGPLVAAYLTLSASDAGAQQLTPAPLNLPEARGRLRNLAYAYQWWVFAAFTVAMAVRIVRDLRRQSLPVADTYDEVLPSSAT